MRPEICPYCSCEEYVSKGDDWYCYLVCTSCGRSRSEIDIGAGLVEEITGERVKRTPWSRTSTYNIKVLGGTIIFNFLKNKLEISKSSMPKMKIYKYETIDMDPNIIERARYVYLKLRTT